MDSRRQLLKKIGLAAAVAATGASTARAARDDTLRAFASGETSTHAPWWLLAPLAPGVSVGRGWTVADLSPVERGAAVLRLVRRDGAGASVHICAHGGRPVGLAPTALFDLVLMDGGDGDLPTDEQLGRAVVGIARRIRRNELRDHAELAGLDRLLTHDERVAIYGPETLT